MIAFGTTHTGSLPRPESLRELLLRRDHGEEVPGLPVEISSAVDEVVARQIDVGLHVVNDGEMSKVGYSAYVKERLGGFDGTHEVQSQFSDLLDHPDVPRPIVRPGGDISRPSCTAPIAVRDRSAVQQDIARLKRAAGGHATFLTAASPGIISLFFADHHYRDRDAYLEAIAEAMRYEYEAIAAAGITLQIDCPDLAMGRHMVFADRPLDEFRREATRAMEALNHATRNIDPAAMRMHVCWGNYEGPHHRDVPLSDIIDIVLRARPSGLVLEASNPRHAHEHHVFEELTLPTDKYVVVGVVDSTSNYIEHPQLVADRLLTYARALGPDRVMAGSDCGFETFATRRMVAPSVVWEKLRSMVEGAALASAIVQRSDTHPR